MGKISPMVKILYLASLKRKHDLRDCIIIRKNKCLTLLRGRDLLGQREKKSGWKSIEEFLKDEQNRPKC